MPVHSRYALPDAPVFLGGGIGYPLCGKPARLTLPTHPATATAVTRARACAAAVRQAAT
jgi:hypothetical protein